MYKIQFKIFSITINNIKIRLDYLLVILLRKYSRSIIKNLIKHKFVLIDGILITEPDYKIIGLHQLTIKILITNRVNIVNGEYMKLKIIYEDNDILIIDKAINIVVHPCDTNNTGTLLNGLLYFYPFNYLLIRAGIVHRLDKNASGLLIIAKNKKIQSYLINLFKYHKIVREYQVLVYGTIKQSEGIINLPLGVNTKYHKRRSVRWDTHGKPAKTKFFVQETFLNFTRLLVKLYTGRTHQIRVHFSYIKHPVVGDFIYGKKVNTKLFKKLNNYSFPRLALQATKLGIYHITYNKYMEWKLNLSNDIEELINFIKNYYT